MLCTKVNYEEYYKTVVRSSKTELHNPRVTFNWGYWDGRSDVKENRPIRDVSKHQDPYYAAGYIWAQESHASDVSSEYAWSSFIGYMTAEEYENTACSIMESLILGHEYLFSNKTDRTEFTDSTFCQIVEHYDSNLPACSTRMMKIKASIVARFCFA